MDDNFKRVMEEARGLLKVGGDLNRALSDILAWADIRAMEGADPMIPGNLMEQAEKALADWRKGLNL